MKLFTREMEIVRKVCPVGISGRVQSVRGMTILATDLPVPIGSLVEIQGLDTPIISGEVVGFDGGQAIVMLLAATTGILPGSKISMKQIHQVAPVGDQMLGRVIDGLGIEITNWSLVAASVLPETPAVDRNAGDAEVTPLRVRQFFDAALRKTVDAQEVDRVAMTAGQAVEGPAIIIESETTTIVTSGFRAVGQGDGSLRLIRKGNSQ